MLLKRMDFMEMLGIIALESERASAAKWYRFGRGKMTENFTLEQYGVEAAAFYTDGNPRRLRRALAEYPIAAAVVTERFAARFGDVPGGGLTVVRGENLYQRLVPHIIKKTAKIAGLDRQNAALAVSGENPAAALALVESVHNEFRYITLISRNGKTAREISDKMLDEYGIAVVVAEAADGVHCDIAVKTGCESLRFPAKTLVIDASAEHTAARENTINWAEVSVRHRLPFQIDSLAFAEGIERITNGGAKFRLRGFRSGNKVIAPGSVNGGEITRTR
jgi:hypothetical protein